MSILCILFGSLSLCLLEPDDDYDYYVDYGDYGDGADQWKSFMDYYNEPDPDAEGATGGAEPKEEPIEPKEEPIEPKEELEVAGEVEISVDSSMPSFSLSDCSWIGEIMAGAASDPLGSDPSYSTTADDEEIKILVPERLGQSHFGKNLNEWNKANLKPAYDDYRYPFSVWICLLFFGSLLFSVLGKE